MGMPLMSNLTVSLSPLSWRVESDHVRSRKSRAPRDTRAAPPPLEAFPTTHPPDLDGGRVVDSLDLALLSSVSAKVMRRRGVSNDLRSAATSGPSFLL